MAAAVSDSWSCVGLVIGCVGLATLRDGLIATPVAPSR
jgi:hypothetical protein